MRPTAAVGDTISTVFLYIKIKGRADEGVTPKASQIFVFFLPKATFGSYERRVIFHNYIHNVSQISANNY